ncbi:MAG: diaminopimelate epimerase [Alphaproteobacteria bacterium]|jgi:diaminopimelate epimerase|nr:diaminopimelate epimerase [Alphaproteobacteria bacterium]
MALDFVKGHGLGNDFVIIDGRRSGFVPDPALVRAIADRRQGVGCDQLIVVSTAADLAAAARMRIWNGDGGEVSACGNASRCVAALMMDEAGSDAVRLETAAGPLLCTRAGAGGVTVDMGPARKGWAEIPLAEPADTDFLPIVAGPVGEPVAVNIGNPHCVFFVADAEAVDVAGLGPALEHHPLFPERTNVEFVSLPGPDRLRMRVWERGAGITRACGTGACAAAVAAHRRGLAGRRVDVVLDGGTLGIEWAANGHVLMTGGYAFPFRGTLPDLPSR